VYSSEGREGSRRTYRFSITRTTTCSISAERAVFSEAALSARASEPTRAMCDDRETVAKRFQPQAGACRLSTGDQQSAQQQRDLPLSALTFANGSRRIFWV
jgi:hypothetical protein